MSEDFSPEKSLRTETDFDTMGWHNATIHAIALPTDTVEIAFDIDYVLKWVDPTEGRTHFPFSVSPTTLVFWNLDELRIDLEREDELSVQGIERSDPAKPRNAAYIGRGMEWRWTIECHQGEIAFRSCGFNRHLRSAPRFGKQQSLSLQKRGGYSFDRPGEWLRRDVYR
jgi:hypothetical protein